MINLFFLKYVWWKKGFVEHGVLQPCHHLIYLHNISKVLPLTSAKTWQRLSKELLLCVSASREYNFRTTSKSNKPKTTSLNEKRKQINSFHLDLRTNIISRHFSYTSKRKSTYSTHKHASVYVWKCVQNPSNDNFQDLTRSFHSDFFCEKWSFLFNFQICCFLVLTISLQGHNFFFAMPLKRFPSITKCALIKCDKLSLPSVFYINNVLWKDAA